MAKGGSKRNVWNKPPEYRWLKAVRICRGLREQPGAIRLAMELFDWFNPDVGYAWPSRPLLADELENDKSAISTWTSKLREVGAIVTQIQAKLPPEMRKAKDLRSIVYVLNIDWADATLREHEEWLATKSKLTGTAPPRRKQMRNGCETHNLSEGEGSVVRPTSDTVVRPTTDLGCETHNTDNLSGQPRENPRKIRTDAKESGVYGIGLGSDLPLDPPETDEEAWRWFERIGLTRDQALPLLRPLRAGRLFQSTVDKVLCDGRRHGRAA